jgi:hypothetical protein
MSIDLQIREQISLYLLGQLDPAELESWLVAATWDIDDEPQAVRRAAFRALRLLSETANGDWTEEELARSLIDLLQTVSPEPSTSLVPEGFLEQLTEAEKQARERQEEREPEQELMGYARFASPTEASYESWQPSDRGFLRQPKGESGTRSPVPAEPAIG